MYHKRLKTIVKFINNEQTFFKMSRKSWIYEDLEKKECCLITSYMSLEKNNHMKKYILTALCAINITLVQSQNSIDSIKLNETSFNHLLNTQFANLIGSNSNSNIGNFAEVNIADAKVKYNSNIQFKDGTIWALSANGGITDGILTLFSKDELNTSIGIGTSFHFLDSDKSLQYKVDDLYKFNYQRDQLSNRYYQDSIAIEKDYGKSKLESEIETLKADSLEIVLKINELNKYISNDLFNKLSQLELDKIDNQITKNRATITKLQNVNPLNQNRIDSLTHQELLLENKKKTIKSKVDMSQIHLDSLNLLLIAKHQEIDEKRKELKKHKLLDKSSKLTKLKANKNRQLKSLQTNTTDSLIETKGFRINWFSAGFNFNHNSFQRYLSMNSFDSQLAKITFSTYEIFAQYSTYNFSAFRNTSYYWNIGAKIGLTSNFGSLNKKSITEQTIIQNSTTIRNIKKDVVAYEGDFKDNLNTLNLFGNIYWFLFKNNSAAIHFFPEYQIREDSEIQTNLGFGISLFYKDKSDKKNIVNSELFINLIDIKNNNKSELDLLNRSTIGINFSFPINIKY